MLTLREDPFLKKASKTFTMGEMPPRMTLRAKGYPNWDWKAQLSDDPARIAVQIIDATSDPSTPEHVDTLLSR